MGESEVRELAASVLAEFIAEHGGPPGPKRQRAARAASVAFTWALGIDAEEIHVGGELSAERWVTEYLELAAACERVACLGAA